MPILRGERVMLRPYRREDLASIMTWTNDDAATRYLGGRFILPYTEKNAEDYLASVMAGAADKAAFVIADAETEDYLGQIDLDMDMHNRQATLGIVLASERNRGRGIGREAIELICRYGFMTLGLNRIQLTVYADNARARRCYAACGFVEEGVQRQARYVDGDYMDSVLMALLRADWDKEHRHD